MADADVEGFTLLSLGLVIIGIRVYVRWTWVGPSNFQLDDYLMPFTGVSEVSSFHDLYTNLPPDVKLSVCVLILGGVHRRNGSGAPRRRQVRRPDEQFYDPRATSDTRPQLEGVL